MEIGVSTVVVLVHHINLLEVKAMSRYIAMALKLQ